MARPLSRASQAWAVPKSLTLYALLVLLVSFLLGSAPTYATHMRPLSLSIVAHSPPPPTPSTQRHPPPSQLLKSPPPLHLLPPPSPPPGPSIGTLVLKVDPTLSYTTLSYGHTNALYGISVAPSRLALAGSVTLNISKAQHVAPFNPTQAQWVSTTLTLSPAILTVTGTAPILGTVGQISANDVTTTFGGGNLVLQGTNFSMAPSAISFTTPLLNGSILGVPIRLSNFSISVNQSSAPQWQQGSISVVGQIYSLSLPFTFRLTLADMAASINKLSANFAGFLGDGYLQLSGVLVARGSIPHSPPPQLLPSPPPPKGTSSGLLTLTVSGAQSSASLTTSGSSLVGISFAPSQPALGGSVVLNISQAQTVAPFYPIKVQWVSSSFGYTVPTIAITISVPVFGNVAQVSLNNTAIGLEGGSLVLHGSNFSFTPSAASLSVSSFVGTVLGISANYPNFSVALGQSSLPLVQGSLLQMGQGFELSASLTINLNLSDIAVSHGFNPTLAGFLGNTQLHFTNYITAYGSFA